MGCGIKTITIETLKENALERPGEGNDDSFESCGKKTSRLHGEKAKRV
jgi:hypothetical protein